MLSQSLLLQLLLLLLQLRPRPRLPAQLAALLPLLLPLLDRPEGLPRPLTLPRCGSSRPLRQAAGGAALLGGRPTAFFRALRPPSPPEPADELPVELEEEEEELCGRRGALRSVSPAGSPPAIARPVPQ
mmetsp:Transcript_24327/g.72369  ORF Transcript_24327/g.72369 Transcript_24327/m.72369 type:complete len:129 (+) Transcript_24327:139-525(+)